MIEFQFHFLRVLTKMASIRLFSSDDIKVSADLL